MTRDAVRNVAKGQIWSGAAAKANGLVDKLGGLLTAVEVLRPLAKIAPDALVSVEQYPSSSDKIQAAINRLMGVDDSASLSSPLARLLRIAGPLLAAIDAADGPAPDERLRAPLP